MRVSALRMSNTRRLRFLFDTKSGATPSSGVEEYWDGNIFWITPEDLGKLKGRELTDTRRKITEEGYRNSGVDLAPAGSLVLSKRAPIGQVAIVHVAATCNQGCFLLTKKEELDERFYYYVLVHFRSYLEILGRGSTFMELASDDLRSVRLPCPSLLNQERIANYLDRETSHIDALIAEKERMLALLEEKRAALISQAVTRGLDPDVPLNPSGLDWLGDIPAHWEVCQQKRVWESNDYGISVSIREDGDIKVLRMSCIVNGRIDLEKAGAVEDVDSYLLLRKRDLLFNRTNSMDQIAKVGILDAEPTGKVSFASYLVRIRVNQRALPEYLVLLLNSKEFIRFARKNAIPAIGQANLSPSKYGELKIPLPPVAEQQRIVESLTELESDTNKLREGLMRSVELLKERRVALITAAVTGQIPPEEIAA